MVFSKTIRAILALYLTTVAYSAPEPNAEVGPLSLVQSRSNRAELIKRDPVADLPFQVALISTDTNVRWDSGSCQGSLIAPNIVVTTASCLMNQNFELYPTSKYYAIMAYEYDIRGGLTQLYEAYKFYPHPDFTLTNTTANIGLIALKESLPLSRAVPAQIYDQEISDSLMVQTPARGVYRTEPGYNYTLEYTDVKITNSSLCGMAIPQNFEGNNSNICAVNTGGKNYCFFGIGGALLTTGSKPQKLVGVFNRLTSASVFPVFQCERNDTLSYYTNLKAYISWINEQRKVVDSLPRAPPNSTVTQSDGEVSSSSNNLTAYKNSLSAFKLILQRW